MASWYCGSNYGWITAFASMAVGLFGSVVYWRAPLRTTRFLRNAATYGAVGMLIAVLVLVPMIANIAFDLPDLCSTSDTDERWRILSTFAVTQLWLLAALATPYIVTPDRTPENWSMADALPRMLTVALGWALAGVLVWMIDERTGSLSTHSATIWGVCASGTLTMLLGRALDLMFDSTNTRIRLLFVAYACVYLGYGLFAKKDAVRLSATSTSKDDDWYNAALERLEKMPEDGPVILVAASGGGARAATFATLVLETLNEKSLFVYERGAAKKMDYTHPPAENIWLISGVSGGSVAAAHYVARHFGNKGKGRTGAVMQNGFPGSLLAGGLEAPVSGLMKSLIQNPRVDESMTDFNAAAITGGLRPDQTRGSALANFWNTRFGWEDSFRSTSVEQRPLVVFNATLAASGRRLLIGEPALPVDLFAHQMDTFTERAPHHVLERARPVVLGELVNRRAPTVGDAVRMSASLPYGMDMATITTVPLVLDAPNPAVEDEGDRRRRERANDPELVGRVLEVSDGGLVDNTGTATLIDVLDALAKEAHTEPLAAKIVSILRWRGVLVVEIDSGAKPVPLNGLAHKLLHPLSVPTAALSGAAYSVERASVLQRRLPNTLGADGWSWASFTYCPKEQDEEVMTAWALGVDEQKNLLEMYAKSALTGDCSTLRERRKRAKSWWAEPTLADPVPAEPSEAAPRMSGASVASAPLPTAGAGPAPAKGSAAERGAAAPAPASARLDPSRASPLNVIAAAMQPAHVDGESAGEALTRAKNAGATGNWLGAAAWSAIGVHLRTTDLAAAETEYTTAFNGAEDFARGKADLRAAVARMEAAGAARVPGVIPLQAEWALRGWIVSRYVDHRSPSSGKEPESWAKLDVPLAVTMRSQENHRVAVTRRITAHATPDFGATDVPIALIRAGTPVKILKTKTASATDNSENWEITEVEWAPQDVDRDLCRGEPMNVIGWCSAADPTDDPTCAPNRNLALRLAESLTTAPEGGEPFASAACVAVQEIGLKGFPRPTEVGSSGGPPPSAFEVARAGQAKTTITGIWKGLCPPDSADPLADNYSWTLFDGGRAFLVGCK